MLFTQFWLLSLRFDWSIDMIHVTRKPNLGSLRPQIFEAPKWKSLHLRHFNKIFISQEERAFIFFLGWEKCLKLVRKKKQKKVFFDLKLLFLHWIIYFTLNISTWLYNVSIFGIFDVSTNVDGRHGCECGCGWLCTFIRWYGVKKGAFNRKDWILKSARQSEITCVCRISVD